MSHIWKYKQGTLNIIDVKKLNEKSWPEVNFMSNPNDDKKSQK